MRRKSQLARPPRGATSDAATSPWDPRSAPPPVPTPGPSPTPPSGSPSTGGGSPSDAPGRITSPSGASSVLAQAGPGPAAWALLPMRFFFGAMFLYAGLDKLLDPAFLRSEGIGSIGEQLHGFVDVSPLAPLISTFALPFPVLVGFGIAVLEIAIGLGALLGLLYRFAAIAGMALSLLFFLTASWDTHPYYLGADLPYAVGWLTLALAGDSGLLTVDAWLRRRDAARAVTVIATPYPARRSGRQAGWQRSAGPMPRRAEMSEAEATTRRRFLELGIVAMASIGVAAFAITSPFRGRLDERLAGGVGSGGGPTPGNGGIGSAGPTPAASVGPGASAAAPSPAASASDGTLIGQLAQVPTGQAATFAIPSTGDPGILVHLGSGDAVAYDALCTHEGCEVEFDSGQALLFCPCHGAVFDPSNGAQVLRGPARRPLPELNIQIDQAGNIYLQP
jgi:thiosulfate dehydrogenase [quinone] large subunit